MTGGRHQQAAPLEALGRALGRAPAHQLDVPGFIHWPDGTLSDGGPPRAAPAASHTPAIQPALGNSAALRRVESGPATNGSPWPEQPCTICRLSGPCLVAVLAVPVLSRDPFLALALHLRGLGSDGRLVSHPRPSWISLFPSSPFTTSPTTLTIASRQPNKVAVTFATWGQGSPCGAPLRCNPPATASSQTASSRIEWPTTTAPGDDDDTTGTRPSATWDGGTSVERGGG